MARYIDADRFKSNLEKAMEKMHVINGIHAVGLEAVLESLNRQPTAEVVAKSEVINTLSDIKRQIHEKAIYPHNAGIKPYISVREVDAIIEAEMRKHKGGEDHV